jgi:hypothetical protein
VCLESISRSNFFPSTPPNPRTAAFSRRSRLADGCSCDRDQHGTRLCARAGLFLMPRGLRIAKCSLPIQILRPCGGNATRSLTLPDSKQNYAMYRSIDMIWATNSAAGSLSITSTVESGFSSQKLSPVAAVKDARATPPNTNFRGSGWQPQP